LLEIAIFQQLSPISPEDVITLKRRRGPWATM